VVTAKPVALVTMTMPMTIAMRISTSVKPGGLRRRLRRITPPAGRFGLDGLIVHDQDDSPGGILAVIDRAEARGLTEGLRTGLRHVKPTVRDATLIAVTRAHQRLSPERLAAVLGIRRATLAERLRGELQAGRGRSCHAARPLSARLPFRHEPIGRAPLRGHDPTRPLGSTRTLEPPAPGESSVVDEVSHE
jgi:hypothetical protein